MKRTHRLHLSGPLQFCRPHHPRNTIIPIHPINPIHHTAMPTPLSITPTVTTDPSGQWLVSIPALIEIKVDPLDGVTKEEAIQTALERLHAPELDLVIELGGVPLNAVIPSLPPPSTTSASSPVPASPFPFLLDWHPGPANGGGGTAGPDQWNDGDHLLVVIRLAGTTATEVMSVSVICEDGKAWMHYQCTGDETGRSLSDVSWWAVLNQKIP